MGEVPFMPTPLCPSCMKPLEVKRTDDGFACKRCGAAMNWETSPPPAAPAAQEGWRPIASAPKDGTIILVFGTDGDQQEICATAWYDGEWLKLYRAVADYPVEVELTHWMPMPPPPTADGG